MLAVVGLNLAWVTAGADNYSCCPAYLDRSWPMVGDVVKFLILAGILVWAVIGSPGHRSAGLFIGLAVP